MYYWSMKSVWRNPSVHETLRHNQRHILSYYVELSNYVFMMPYSDYVELCLIMSDNILIHSSRGLELLSLKKKLKLSYDKKNFERAFCPKLGNF